MRHLNVEIKAHCRDADAVRGALRARGADFRGTDRQADTYFRAPAGRLKLREGTIENHLIWYERGDEPGPKRADVLLADTPPDSGVKEVLARALGVRAVVEKRREIYFLGNVKFHVDEVAGLGCFVEIEAQTIEGGLSEAELRAQCEQYLALLGIRREDLIRESYGDMVLRGR